jgi:hypothetical protein
MSAAREEKRQHYSRALALAPFCWPAAQELCLLEGKPLDECRRTAAELRSQEARYF